MALAPVVSIFRANTFRIFGANHPSYPSRVSIRKEIVMPIIKARTTQKQLVRHITRLYRENNETLFAYAKFIGEPTEYVLNQLVETLLAKDKDFQTWREQNPGSH